MAIPGILLPLPRLGITPAASAKAFFYQPGTTTKISTYTASDLATPNANPLVADAAGMFGAIYLDPTVGCKVVVYASTETNDPPTGTPLYTQDNAYLPSMVLPQVLSKSGNYTVATSDGFNVLIDVDASGGAVTISPYTAVGNTGGRITVKKTDSSANAVTIDPNGAQTIDGSTTKALASQYDALTIESNGVNWDSVAQANLTPSYNGIVFPATQVPSSGANTFDDYEEGTWTPTDGSGAALTFTSVEGKYLKMGQLVIASCTLTFPATADGSSSAIAGLPFTAMASSNSIFSSTIGGLTTETTVARVSVVTGDVKALPYTTGAARVTNATLSSDVLSFTAIYRASA